MLKVTHDRLSLMLGDHETYCDIRREGHTLFLDYVFAPEALRGTGAAKQLLQHIVNYAHHERLNIVPICGYAKAVVPKLRPTDIT